jgi:hypothetical protein
MASMARILRAGLWGCLAIVLAWFVVSQSLVAYLANTAPGIAVKLRWDEPRALLNLVEQYLQTDTSSAGPSGSPDGSAAPSPSEDRLRALIDAARPLAQTEPRDERQGSGISRHDGIALEDLQRWSELALARDPINARALRLLGQLALRQGDEARAERFMTVAVHASVRESVAVHWLMQRKFDQRDYPEVLSLADTLLRTRSQILPYVVPTLARMAEIPAAKEQLKELLATNPPWRSQFFGALPRAVSDARTPLELLLSLRETTEPPNASDLRSYLDVLIQHKLYELAYYTWLQFLPPEQLSSTGLLFNGSFERTPSGLQFDWTLPTGNGATIDIAQRPDQPDQRALLIELGPGRVEFPGIQQMLLLAPGTYSFKGQYKGEIIGRRGFVWRATCVGAPSTPLGQSPMMIGAIPSWQPIEFSFTVPEKDCRAQHVRLELDARMASEQLVSGTVWCDELSIARKN